MLMGKRPHLSPLDASGETHRVAPGGAGSAPGDVCRDRGLYRFLRRRRGGGAVLGNADRLRRGVGPRRPSSWTLRSSASLRLTRSTGTVPTRSGTAWCGRFARSATGRPPTASRSPCRTITTSRCTARRCWNCWATSIGRTASWASTPGRRPCAARTCTTPRADGAAHGHHHQRRLRAAAAVSLSAGGRQLRARPARPGAGGPFGEGCIDYRAFFQGLHDGGFDGWANYEMCSPIRGGGAADNLDAYAAGYVRWMRDNTRQAGAS